MTPEQHMMKRAEIVSEYMEEIAEHESAGEFGDAENALAVARALGVTLDEMAEGDATCGEGWKVSGRRPCLVYEGEDDDDRA